MLALLTLAHAAPPDVAADLIRFNTAAKVPLPTLTAPQRVALASGEVVRFIETVSDGNLRVVGFALLQAPQKNLFIASQHPRYASATSSLLIEHRISAEGDQSVWYGILDLPRPFIDRHWVVNSWNHHATATSSDGAHWEHLWALHPEGVEPAVDLVASGGLDGVSLERFEEAIAVPASVGGVVFLNVGEGWTLVGYHSVFDIGGRLPERPMAEWVKHSMESYFASLHTRAIEDVPRDYRADAELLLGADGVVIPAFP